MALGSAPKGHHASVRGVAEVDALEEVFSEQWRLNKYTFERNGLVPFESIPLDPALQNMWLRNYALAMTQELAELVDSTNWKWWRTKVDLLDEQNIKVELVDILHFWVSACQVMGMSPDEVLRLYRKKNAVNVQRQDTGYVEKTDDNLRVT